MKKALYLILVVAMVCVSLLAVAAPAFAVVEESECDRVFVETVEELYPDQLPNITAQKELLYDIYLEPLGYIYIFDMNGTDNYAVVINADGNYECTEIYFDAQNPYENMQGQKVYVTVFVYWTYDDGVYYGENGLPVSEEVFAHFAERAYFGGGTVTYSTATVTFTNRVDNKNELAFRVPQYSGTGACVPIAGGNVIHYWTRYKSNLMPSFTPGSSLGASYLYATSGAAITSMVAQLETDMGTTVSGTTIAQFKSGMTTFVNRQGYSVSYTSCISSGVFSYSTAKTQLASKPLVLFCNPYAAATLSVSGSTESINTMLGDAAHAMASFGYREITYTFSNNTTRTDNYLQVSTGLSARTTGYCKMGGDTVIDDAYAINIS
jgi:hypothetical protein